MVPAGVVSGALLFGVANGTPGAYAEYAVQAAETEESQAQQNDMGETVWGFVNTYFYDEKALKKIDREG